MSEKCNKYTLHILAHYWSGLNWKVSFTVFFTISKGWITYWPPLGHLVQHSPPHGGRLQNKILLQRLRPPTKQIILCRGWGRLQNKSYCADAEDAYKTSNTFAEAEAAYKTNNTVQRLRPPPKQTILLQRLFSSHSWRLLWPLETYWYECLVNIEAS